MKQAKRFLALAMAFCLTLGLAAPAAAAGESAEDAVLLELQYNDEYTAATTEVTIPAGETVYYYSYMLGGMIVTIEDEQACITYGGTAYDPENGVLSVEIPSTLGRVRTDLAITNNGGGEKTFTLHVAPPMGTFNNPQVLTDSQLAGFTADLAEGDDDGYYFQWTATSSGYLCVSAESAGVDCDVILYNTSTWVQTSMWVSNSEGSDVCSSPAVVWVNEGDVVSINLAVKAENFKYPAATVTASGSVSAGNANDPIPVSVTTFVARVGAGETVCYGGLYSSGMDLTVSAADLTGVTVTCGSTSYTDEDGDGVISFSISRRGFGGSSSAVSITNSGESVGYYTISVPAGQESNPAGLVLGVNKVDLADSQSYYYNYTVTENGELTLAIDTGLCSDWYFTYDVYHADGSCTYGDYAYSDVQDDPSSMTVSVQAGDVVKVTVSTASGDAGTVVLNTSFEAAADVPSDPCANGHTYTTETVESTCTEQGYTTYTCTVCGDSYVDDYTDVVKHECERVEIEATCTTDSGYKLVCKHCGWVEGIAYTGPANGHKWDSGVLVSEATETTKEIRTFTCTVCGESVTCSPDELEHVHDFTSVYVEPTCEQDGYTLYTCSICDFSYHGDPGAPRTGHSYTDVVTEATCTEAGYITSTCQACGDVVVMTIADPTGVHDYDDEGVCAHCGKLSLDHRFIDIPADAWYYEAVDYVVERGFMNGTGGAIFAPTAVVTRATVAQLLYNIVGRPDVSGFENPFYDVKEGDWYYAAVVWAANTGVVSGNGQGGFNPNDNVTREQLAIMICNFSNSMGYDLEATKDVDLSSFVDGDKTSTWAVSQLKWACDLGLIGGKASGDVTYLAPQDTATRMEIATIFMRFYQMVENG